jgi:hypothetical protein
MLLDKRRKNILILILYTVVLVLGIIAFLRIQYKEYFIDENTYQRVNVKNLMSIREVILSETSGSSIIKDDSLNTTNSNLFLINCTFSNNLCDKIRKRVVTHLSERYNLFTYNLSKKRLVRTEIIASKQNEMFVREIVNKVGGGKIYWTNGISDIFIWLGRDLLLPGNKWSERIEVDKSEFSLKIFRNNKIFKKYLVSIGSVRGDKREEGDCRTPEGLFWIIRIEDSRNWEYDFGDGNGLIRGAYGPYFFRLYTGKDVTFSGRSWKGIGIHGTHDPKSIGTRSSHGCIRMINQDILELTELIDINTPVFIKL